MAQKFKKGDVVALKSGGPDMTIARYKLIVALAGPSRESDDQVECIWFDGLKKSEGSFHQDTLEKSED